MGAPRFNADEAVALRRGFSLGLAVSPPKTLDKPVLAQLALLGAWNRCERPVVPEFADVPVPPQSHNLNIPALIAGPNPRGLST